MSGLLDTLRECPPRLPGEFAREGARLFEAEHLQKLSARLLDFFHEGPPAEPPAPHLAAEITPSMATCFAPFADAMNLWTASAEKTAPDVVAAMAQALAEAGSEKILVLLGQRITPGSLTDFRAIPPPRDRLLSAAIAPVNAQDSLSVAARAWAKHAARSGDPFWGTVRGNPAERNRVALEIIDRILDQPTWWNVFSHFQHLVVFEARQPSGHGARWEHDGEEFIGFLDPFDAEQRFSAAAEPDA